MLVLELELDLPAGVALEEEGTGGEGAPGGTFEFGVQEDGYEVGTVGLLD